MPPTARRWSFFQARSPTRAGDGFVKQDRCQSDDVRRLGPRMASIETMNGSVSQLDGGAIVIAACRQTNEGPQAGDVEDLASDPGGWRNTMTAPSRISISFVAALPSEKISSRVATAAIPATRNARQEFLALRRRSSGIPRCKPCRIPRRPCTRPYRDISRSDAAAPTSNHTAKSMKCRCRQRRRRRPEFMMKPDRAWRLFRGRYENSSMSTWTRCPGHPTSGSAATSAATRPCFGAGRTLSLNLRTGNVAIGTEHTVVPILRTKDCPALLAFISRQKGFGRHYLSWRWPQEGQVMVESLFGVMFCSNPFYHEDVGLRIGGVPTGCR